ncbi:MAG: hypothetical protein J3R72DRAFT_176102 [Linnemannia gamsii]|nr:MAG: hypothetical protein J3R72DRAFT_176102 [Linnemannia gamsii]
MTWTYMSCLSLCLLLFILHSIPPLLTVLSVEEKKEKDVDRAFAKRKRKTNNIQGALYGWRSTLFSCSCRVYRGLPLPGISRTRYIALDVIHSPNELYRRVPLRNTLYHDCDRNLCCGFDLLCDLGGESDAVLARVYCLSVCWWECCFVFFVFFLVKRGRELIVD